MSIIIRPARLCDIEVIAPYIQMASGGISEFLLTDLVPGMSVSDLIEMALTDENTTYYYQNFLVAECEKKIVAAGNYYPAEAHGLPDIMRSFIAREKLDVIQPYMRSSIKHSMYVNTLAVAPEYRNTFCGLLLAKGIERIAKERGMRCLSAHVWRDNTLVYNGLKMAGFEKVETIDIIEHPDLPHKGGMVLLKGPDFIPR